MILLCLCLAQVGMCQPAAIQSAYRLGPEDVIRISIVAGGEEQVAKEMVVSDTGHVNAPFIGKVDADGLTLEELEQSIVGPLEKDYFVAPQVHLQIEGYHSLQYFISGAVKKPGMYEMGFKPSIMDLIAHAGGVLPERGNLAYVIRGTASSSADADDPADGKPAPIKVDLVKLLDEGDMSQNIRLMSGDTIYIPLDTGLDQASTKVYVQGKVKNPGVFNYQPGLTALAACIMAGGFDRFAAPNRAKIIRQTTGGQETIDLDLNKVISGKLPDLPLRPGDRIHIPESWL